MTDIDVKRAIQSALQSFGGGDLTDNALRFFQTLGYNTDRQNPLSEKTVSEFKDVFPVEASPFNAEKALCKEWRSIDLLFQLTREEMDDQKSLFATGKVKWQGEDKESVIETYLFFALELMSPEYPRSALARITREINKIFSMPVMLLIKHGEHLTFSVINRRLNKKDDRKDVLEKVTLIKDISIASPHRAHIEILFDLSLKELRKNHKIDNFLDFHNAWRKTLDTKELNKRFYRDLSNWYFWALGEVNFPGGSHATDRDSLFKDQARIKEHNAKNLIRLLTRLLFVWFVKEKHLIPDELFDEAYIREHLLNGFEPRKRATFSEKTKESKYYRAILQNLFFATLNQNMGSREFRKPGQHMNISNLMRYESYFKNPRTFLNLVEKVVPFMNGGLFECLDSPDPNLKGPKGGDVILYEDGFSDRKDNPLCVPDYVFFGMDEHADLSEELGNKKQKDVAVNGLIHILKSYKFTVTENTPIEEDIALDPELLGRVFENLLASYNPETKTTARKQTGSFYTPREIVSYMVDESLKAYLAQKLSADAEMDPESAEIGLDVLLGYNEKDHLFDERETAVLINAVDTCKILDPACGSGAFPMGILHKLVHILHKLDPNNEQWRDLQRQKAIRETEAAFNIGNKQEREDRLKEISDVFENNSDDYGRKLFLIENCIYGVDIQPIAIQISKLRFFISLVVDQKIDPSQDNFGVRPLPNLETRFVAANTLIRIEKPDQQLDLFEDKKVKKLEEKLKDVRHRLFSAKTPATKRKLREEDQRLREEMGKLLTEHGYGNETARKLASWDPYDQNASSPFFDPEWMFGIVAGFDVVIGNPPYLRIQGIQESNPDFVSYAKKHYKSAAKGNWDLYVLFTEAGFELLKPKGMLAFIQPHKFFQAEFGASIRNYIAQARSIYKIVHFGAEQMFESATNYTCLFFMQRTTRQNFAYINVEHPEKWLENTAGISPFVLPQPEKNQKWTFTNQEKHDILQKIQQQPQTLGDVIRKIFQGIATSADKIYVLKIKNWGKDTVRAYSASLGKDVEIERGLVKPFLMGKDVKRYEKPEPKNVVIFPYVIEDGKAALMSPEYIRKNFPMGWKYLEKNKTELENREKGKMRHQNFYAYIYPKNLTEFDSVKILTPEIAIKPQLTLDAEGICYHTTKVYSFVFKENIKENRAYWLGLLNSKLLWTFLNSTGYVLRGGYFTFKTEYLKPFPIRRIDFKNTDDRSMHNRIVELVTTILSAKQSGKDTFKQEAEVDAAVFKLYGFSEDEMLTALLQMPDVSEAERREIQFQFKSSKTLKAV